MSDAVASFSEASTSSNGSGPSGRQPPPIAPTGEPDLPARKKRRARRALVELHYLGPEGTYSHQVAEKVAEQIFRVDDAQCDRPKPGVPLITLRRSPVDPADIELKPCSTIEQAFSTAKKAALGRDPSLVLLPWENNSNGPVEEAHKLLHEQRKLRVVGEVVIEVRHSLLASRATYERLKDTISTQPGQLNLQRLDAVYSHSQALGQCAGSLTTHLRPDAARIAMASTAKAAKLMAERADAAGDGPLEACIASSICTRPSVYNLVELLSDVQDSAGNLTRFLVVEVIQGSKMIRLYSLKPPEPSAIPRERALLRINTVVAGGDDNLGTDSFAEKLFEIMDFRGRNFQQYHIRHRIRKIDRRSRREGLEQEPSGRRRNGVPQDGDNYPRAVWGSTYLVEVEAEHERGYTGVTHYELVHDYLEVLASCFGVEHPHTDSLGVWHAP